MISTPTPQLGIPDELRAVAERRVEHAKGAFADFMRAAQGVVSALEDRVTARQAGLAPVSWRGEVLGSVYLV